MKEICFVCVLVGLWLLPAAIVRVIGYRVYKSKKEEADRAWHAFQIEKGRRDMAEKNLRGLHRVETMLLDNPVGKKVTNKIGRKYTVIGYLKIGNAWVLKLGTGQKKGGGMYDIGTMKPENVK